jgi:hypothetical protein
MLHIIGVAHRAQSLTPGAEETEAQQAFTRRLNRIIQEVGPAFIAEQDSEEALAERHATSIAKRIADEKGIDHRFCDPTRSLRDALHYTDGMTIEEQMHMGDAEGLSDAEIHLKARAIELGRYFPIREHFWLERLVGCLDQDTIFACGDAHIETFTGLLDRQGIPYKIIERGIGVTAAAREDFRRIVDYLTAHPQLTNR